MERSLCRMLSAVALARAAAREHGQLLRGGGGGRRHSYEWVRVTRILRGDQHKWSFDRKDNGEMCGK